MVAKKPGNEGLQWGLVATEGRDEAWQWWVAKEAVMMEGRDGA